MSQSSNAAQSTAPTPGAPRLGTLAGHPLRERLELGCTVMGVAVLLTQPNALLILGLALVAVPWILRLATRQGIPSSPLDVPLSLYIASAAIGLVVTSDPVTANIRWWGILAAAGMCYAVLRLVWSARVCIVSLWVTLAAGVLGSLVLLMLTQGRVARGPIGRVLDPLLAWFQQFPPMTEPVMRINTRFIVNYNGLADLGLLAAVAGLLLARLATRAWVKVCLLCLVAAIVLLVLATGGRGGVLGLMGAALVLALAGHFGRSPSAEVDPPQPRLSRRVALAIVAVLLVGLALGLSGLIDKGFELTSMDGRILFWRELLGILGDYAFTGVGLGMQAPLNAIIAYGLTKRWIDMVYAHNMFLQTYLEQGPLGLVSLVLILLVALVYGVRALRHAVQPQQRAAASLGLAVVVGTTLHGLTDQVPTSNIGTLILLAATALTVAVSAPEAAVRTGVFSSPRLVIMAIVMALGLGLLVTHPRQPADALANLGALEVAKAVAVDQTSLEERYGHVETGQRLLRQAVAWSPEHPAALRQLARAAVLRNDLAGAADALRRATAGHQLSPLDEIQIGRLYYSIGFLDDGYRWTRQGYLDGGGLYRSAAYEYYRLQVDEDWRVRTLVEQAETLRNQKNYQDALPLFQQALSLAPENRYLADQVDEVGRDLTRKLRGG